MGIALQAIIIIELDLHLDPDSDPDPVPDPVPDRVPDPDRVTLLLLLAMQ